jgi:large subunit ribosomal protein L24
MPKPPIPYAGKMFIKKGDRVMIISGKDKGQIGTVSRVLPKAGKLVIVDDTPRQDENGKILAPRPLNRAIKHVRAQPTVSNPNPESGRIEIALPLHISKVQLVNAEGKPTRIGCRSTRTAPRPASRSRAVSRSRNRRAPRPPRSSSREGSTHPAAARRPEDSPSGWRAAATSLRSETGGEGTIVTWPKR